MNQSPSSQSRRTSIGSLLSRRPPPGTVAAAIALGALLTIGIPAAAQIPRALGLDISAWQGNISQTTWNNLRNVENRQFIILRSSRGGTTGYYNQNDASNSQGLNTLSQRYDDPYYIQNINRVTAAGMFAGSYHFSRPDIIASTLNANGIPNSGADEADHFIQMAGPWMRPGYLVPVHDFEAGDGARTDNELTQFCVDFSNRIYERMGIRPAIYTGGNYSANILQTASSSLRNQLAQPPANLPSVIAPCYPVLWNARWPNQADPNSIDVQNGNPKDSYSGFYGPWDDYSGPSHPWVFWQYASTLRLQSFNNGGNNLDADVAHGGIEFLKDQLIPAVWLNDSSGDWSTLTNWNCGLPPAAPVTGTNQVPPVGPQTLPTPRLPGGAGNAVTSGTNDTVILERPNANITVTLSSGTHHIRKLYQRETLNLTGGSLTVGYAPSADSTTHGAQFSGSVTLSNSASFSVHTLQVDATQTFKLASGTLTFDTINLLPGATPAKILMQGDVTFNALPNRTATIAQGGGSGNSGLLDLGGGPRGFNVGHGTSDIDLSLDVPISNGALGKTGLGTLRLNSANTYAGGTTVSAGRLLVNNVNGSGTGSGDVTVNGGSLGGTGTIAGTVIVNSGGTISPGTSIGTLTLNRAPVFHGTNFMEIDRNGGSPLADRILLTSGTLTYDGTLVVSNAGATLLGGEVFTLYTAPAYSGAFAAYNLPPLNAGLNWFTGGLVANGTIKVNRRPVIASPLTFTNTAPSVLSIPFATLTGNATDADADSLAVAGFDPVTINGITLTTNGSSLSYSNRASVMDEFHYVVSDGRGGSATGTVSIVNIGSSPAAQFTSTPSPSGTSVLLHFSATPGWTYHLERSTNLPAWVTIWTNIAPPTGVFDFTDDFHDLNGPPSTAFYRLRWLP